MVVQDFNVMVVFNLNIYYIVVDGGIYIDEVEVKGIVLVLVIYLDGEDWGFGCMDMVEIFECFDVDVVQGVKEDFLQCDFYDVFVVGVGFVGVVVVVYVVCKGICIVMVGF